MKTIEKGKCMEERDHVITSMLHELAETVINELPKVTNFSKGPLRAAWQSHWKRALLESDGDVVKLADAACEELKMLVLATLMEGEQRASTSDASS